VENNVLKNLKIVSGLACFLMLASHVWSMSHWNEARGVHDDICYLRQAHLFQKHGLRGLDTDLVLDDDHYLAGKLKELGFPTGASITGAPCHILMPATQKQVIQYPPGTGFVLALFPSGFQVIPLYISATVVIFGFALLAVFCAPTRSSILLAGVFGVVAIYLMINPAKASYSMAPTMVVSALVGLLTARLFAIRKPGHELLITMFVGFLIGLSINFRLANLFLSAGYFVFFFVSFLLLQRRRFFAQGAGFAVAFLFGMAPTLAANTINAGSPFSTTYGGGDVVPPGFNIGILLAYLKDTQFILLVLAGVWTIGVLRSSRNVAERRVALVAGANLVVNVVFFLSHPVFTPYYTIPVAMLSLWSLLFAHLMRSAAAVAEIRLGQAASA
jgi:hypothetical protein